MDNARQKAQERYAAIQREKAPNAPLCACGCGQQVQWCIYTKKYKRFRFNHHQRRESVLLTPRQQQIILGTMLGDGSANFVRNRQTGEPTNARLRIRHSTRRQLEYAKWLHHNLQPLSGKFRIRENKGYGQEVAEFNTLSHPFIYEAAQQIYRPQKSITRSVPGPLGRTGLRGVVDGRRIDGLARNSRLHGSRERAHRRLAAGAVGNCCQHQHGPAGAEALPVVSPAERRDVATLGGSACDSVAVVQVRAIPADALVRGTVVTVRRTGRCVETYDIGVAKNHNFFADGVLIHNCQHDAASSCAHLHNVIRPRWILGLTATPFRMDHVKLCFDAVVKDAGIHQLIQDGYLSRFDHYTIPKWEVSQLADFYCAEPSRWGKSIFYFHSIEECRRLNAVLRERGIASDVVTGSTDRERQLAAFRAGSLQVLINCMVLAEGFDDPTLQTVWVRPSGRGPTIQMAGRVLRRCGDAIKQVVQCRQTHHPFAKTATPHQSYLWQSGQWRSLTINPQLNLCNHNARLAIAATVVALPKFLDRKRIRPRRASRER